jgi:hypothetical protein
MKMDQWLAGVRAGRETMDVRSGGRGGAININLKLGITNLKGPYIFFAIASFHYCHLTNFWEKLENRGIITPYVYKRYITLSIFIKTLIRSNWKRS